MSGNISAVSSVQSSFAAASQEAAETRATTMQEAARGDQQAVRKLAREQANQPVPQAAQVSTPMTQSDGGNGVNVLA
jgi:hypothetical protein